MLTRNEIDDTISNMQMKVAAEASGKGGEQEKLANLFIGGLALLGNFLGDISDIARAHRYNSATAFRDRTDER